MRKTPAATYLWPGLPQLWVDGAWSGLILATGFAVLLNFLLLATWVWSELLSLWLVKSGWLSAAGIWCCAAIVSSWLRRSSVGQTAAASAEDLLRSAQSEYLRGHWSEAHSVLDQLLEHFPKDVEARLLLATLLRRTKRYKEAREALVRLERLELAAAWKHEIDAEWQRLQRHEETAIETESDQTGASTTKDDQEHSDDVAQAA